MQHGYYIDKILAHKKSKTMSCKFSKAYDLISMLRRKNNMRLTT